MREVDRFDPADGPGWRAPHPFGRVPVLSHGAFTLCETGAIILHVDRAFDGPTRPHGPWRGVL
ncbi:MAG: glutathione S-transferase N-terminal domain-containing protein [Jannaschia sp.]